MYHKRVTKKRLLPKRVESKKDSLWEKVILAVIVTVFSILGSFIATFISKNIEETVWIRNETFEYRKTIYFKRIEISDQVTRIFAKRGIAKALSVSLEMYPTLSIQDFEKVPYYEIGQDIRNLRTSRDEITVEYVSAMMLASTYFGPETKAAIKKIQETHNPDWWNVDDEQIQAVLGAMGSELGYGFENINLKGFLNELPTSP
jgi:hypothetical protein